jgi:hypothetical protein
MRVRLGVLRSYLREALSRVDEEAWMPGRWYPSEGEPVDPADAERLGETDEMDETDARMQGDGRGPGDTDANEKIASHLRGDEDKTSLGDPDDETMRTESALRRELRRFFLQEDPAAASGSDPTKPGGAYSAFDMTRDHTGTDDLSATWYRSPGREPGGDGDPFRGPDPYAQLGFHTPKAQNDPTASPPGADGEVGTQARLAPPIWQLSAGSDTSKVLGAGARAGGSDVGSDGEQKEDTEGAEDGDDTGEEGSPEGGEQGQGHPQRGGDR